MQLVEVSEIGVRAAIIRMRSNRARLEWLLFPMIHLGEPSYYGEVEKRLQACDLVLAEGVDSHIVEALTRAYGFGARGSSALPQTILDSPPAHQHLAVENSDISGQEFDAAWRKMPLGLRIGIPVLAPLFGLWLRFVAKPESWHSELQVDDLPTNEEVLLEGRMPEMFELLLHRRNRHLFDQIEALQQRWGGETKTVGVAWGARHIGAVTEFLSEKWHYFPVSAEWVSVFDYTQ